MALVKSKRHETMVSSSCITGRHRSADRQRSQQRRNAQLSITAMVALLCSSGVTSALASSVRKEPKEPTLLDQQLQQSEPNHTPADQQRRRLRSTAQQTTTITNNQQRKLQPPSNDHPWLPSYPDLTCLNTRPADTWETGHELLEQCCQTNFGWDAAECVLTYDKLPTAKKVEEQEVDDSEDEQEVYEYSFNNEDGTCYNTSPVPSLATGYNSLKKCCGQNFKHDMSHCLSFNHAQLEENENPFLPDYGNHVCNQNRVPTAWEGKGYTSLGECCGDYFDWNLDNCLGIVSDDDEDDLMEDGDTNGSDANVENEMPNEYPDTWWHPQWQKGHCVTNHDTDPPSYMAADPENTMSKTYSDCCQDNFFDEELQPCLEDGAKNALPTRPPASDGTTGVTTVDLKLYYYPKYTKDKCYLDAHQSPSYMRKDPMAYFTQSAGECCREHFPREVKSCVKASPILPTIDDDIGEGTEDNNPAVEAVNPARYKYQFYPKFRDESCLKNIQLDAPSYMFDSPSDFFFVTFDECCSYSYELEYKDCLKNSKLAEIGDGPPIINDGKGDGDEDDNGNKEPAILIRFQGKLYFRNVFIPTSTPANLRIVRDAILNSIKVALGDDYPVVEMIGSNFDGINMVNLDDLVNGDTTRGRRRLGVPVDIDSGYVPDDAVESHLVPQDGIDHDAPSETTPSRRHLARNQLFLFDMAISLPCDTSCLSDMTMAGRSASFDITDLFDDAIQNGDIFRTVLQDMESMGYPGPFNSASLNEGVLQYQNVNVDARYTGAPTVSGAPTPRPTWGPGTEGPTTKKPSRRPTLVPTDIPTEALPFYPDLESGSCLADGKQMGDQVNLFDTFDECCNFNWLERATCITVGKAMGYEVEQTLEPTNRPTNPPTPTPEPTLILTPEPTPEPTPAPSTNPTPAPSKGPTKKPVPFVDTSSDWPTFSPTTDAPTSMAPQANVPPQTGKPSTDSDCTEYGWHVDRRTNDGCTNDKNIVDSWLQPNNIDQMFHPTKEACCEEFFSGIECKIRDIGCGVFTSEPTPAPPPPVSSPTIPIPSPPTSSPTNPDAEVPCDTHGWHLDLANQGGCTNDKNIIESWLTGGQMILPTKEECCQKFSGGNCNAIDICQGPGPAPSQGPSPSSPSDSEDLLFEDFEGGSLSLTEFTTSSVLPWTIDEEYVYTGTKSIKNSVTSKGESSTLTLSMDFPIDGALTYKLRHDIFMPWASLEVSRDGEAVAGYLGHSGQAGWGTEMVLLKKGVHEIVWDVNTRDAESPPNPRGEGTVWIDDVRFVEAVIMDWEDGEIDNELVSFSGIGRWRVDDSLPIPPTAKTGMAVHSPKGLLPGEYSTLNINHSFPNGGVVSFDCFLGLGTMSFLLDDVEKFSENRPGRGVQSIEETIPPGEHTFSWKYEPPTQPNLPLSQVWLDNVNFI